MELIFAVSVAGLMLVGLLTAVTFNVKTATLNKVKLGAIAVLNKEIEQIRAMKYKDIGIISQNPAGTLEASGNYEFNKINYTVIRNVAWVDSDKDGIGVNDTDSNPDDFKQVKITVTWNVRNTEFSVDSLTYVYGY